MARQKSEDPIVPEGSRKASPTEHSARGGKGVPVEQETGQLGLPLATAECPKGAAGRHPADRSARRATRAVPKASVKSPMTLSATMESVVEHLDEALAHVARNRGAPGADGRTIGDVQSNWAAERLRLERRLRSGEYWPGEIRRVLIPKPGGGERELGIPNVVDRVVQESVRLVLQPVFEPGFHASSHGFRPGRSCHTALAEANQYVADGHTWVVDIDLSRFFDRVNHQRLMARVSREIDDRGLLVLLGRLLKASVLLPDGVVTRTDEGVPQGGPLSPLLSNIVLDELDQELCRRGHRFTRYADDVAIFVRSERAGERVLQSLTRFIEGRMRLRVNTAKSAVRRPSEGNYLGFCQRVCADGAVETLLSERTMRRAKEKIRSLTPRNWGGSLRSCLARLERYFTGWFAYFGVCSPRARSQLRTLDGRARRRIRALQLKHWKRKRTIVRHLNRMKYSRKVAPRIYGGRRSWWDMSNAGVVTHRLSTQWMKERGLTSLVSRYDARHNTPMEAPAQLRFEWG